MKKILLIITFSLICNFIFSDESDDRTKYDDDVRYLMELTMTDLGRESFAKMLSMNIDNYRRILPDVPERIWTEIYYSIDIDEMIDLILPIYDKYYTHDEIKEIINFLESPIGRKYTEANHKITMEAMDVGKEFGERLDKRIADRLEALWYY